MAKEGAQELAMGDKELLEELPADTAAAAGGQNQRPVVVGVGASAGGLDALMHLLQNIPDQPGMSFVIVQHLDPTHKSRLAEILERNSRLPVHEVVGETLVKDGHVYVIPPGKYMAIEKCVLKLSEPERERGSRMAIDFFFRSLAEDCCEFAIGLVLSGTGTDGTAGLKEIKHFGGLTVVQQPSDAGHDGMPRSAIASVDVDWVLSASEMAPRLTKYVEHARRSGLLAAQADVHKDHHLKPILEILRKQTKQDFRRYRQNTLRRRIQRRMGLHQLSDINDYVHFLKDSPEECRSLRCDLLIGVTKFFRNPEAWQLLEQKVIQPWAVAGEAEEAIRVWCAGCATGEEAYSLAMLCLENANTNGKQARFQIFATDVAGDALQLARDGLYPASIAADVSSSRLHRFFVKEGDHYRVSRQLREAVVFAEQDVLAHPPFSKLDLISCRNLMIYLENDAQQRVMDVFRFALEAGGGLFLGNSESGRALASGFTPISKKWRIYRRDKDAVSHSFRPMGDSFPGEGEERQLPTRKTGGGVATLVQRQLLRQLKQGLAVVDANDRVIYIHGRADLYLQLNLGEVSDERPEILDMAREGLRSKLRPILREVRQGQSSETRDARVRRDGRYHPVQIEASPLHGAEAAILITFTPDPAPARRSLQKRQPRALVQMATWKRRSKK